MSTTISVSLKWLLVGLFATASLAMAGCGGSNKSDSVRPTLVGAWKPAANPIGQPLNRDAVIRFKTDGTWTGSDGCNKVVGKYSVDDGQFSSSPDFLGIGTGCIPPEVEFNKLLAKATQVDLTTSRASFLDESGSTILTLDRQ